MLKFAFSLLGAAALAIGGMIFVIGPEATGQTFAAMLRLLAPETPRVSGLSGADIDSEMRFYAVLWMAYGAAALWVARGLPERMGLMRLMLGVFLLGGLGRVISYFVAGAPHPLFIALMWIEIIFPLALTALSYRGAKPGAS
ncbi:MAG: DUF4345 family protein [Hyphomonadaceae bacterium]